MDQVRPADTFVHLVGVANPGPLKAEQFRTVDLASVRASLPSARSAAVGHFVYVSVAQPAPIMKTYIRARKDCEAIDSGQRAERHNTAPLVCPRPRSLVAVRPRTVLLAL